MRKIAFPPLVDNKSKVLLLGTMPGVESLRKQQYYGNKYNQFWNLIFALFKEPFSDNYEDRKNFLLSKQIALWDVIKSCEGVGSLDSNIRNEQPNDFGCFYLNYPAIGHVLFTSRKAEAFYKKYIGFGYDKIYLTLPSPSPANARMKFDEKLKYWNILLEILS